MCAFYRTKLATIKFAEDSNLIGIDNEAFCEVHYLKYVVIPESVTVIASNAFTHSTYNINDLVIYTLIYEVNRPERWHTNCFGDLDIYWLDEWYYDENGIPIPN